MPTGFPSSNSHWLALSLCAIKLPLFNLDIMECLEVPLLISFDALYLGCLICLILVMCRFAIIILLFIFAFIVTVSVFDYLHYYFNIFRFEKLTKFFMILAHPFLALIHISFIASYHIIFILS